jgi:hypothetical protein
VVRMYSCYQLDIVFFSDIAPELPHLQRLNFNPQNLLKHTIFATQNLTP